MSRYQIRRGPHGIALYDGETPLDALYAFLADWTRAAAKPTAKTSDDGESASLVHDGEEYEAVRVGPAHEEPIA